MRANLARSVPRIFYGYRNSLSIFVTVHGFFCQNIFSWYHYSSNLLATRFRFFFDRVFLLTIFPIHLPIFTEQDRVPSQVSSHPETYTRPEPYVSFQEHPPSHHSVLIFL